MSWAFVNEKSTGTFRHIFITFSEYMNFKDIRYVHNVKIITTYNNSVNRHLFILKVLTP